jgi:hypothetical protein
MKLSSRNMLFYGASYYILTETQGMLTTDCPQEHMTDDSWK